MTTVIPKALDPDQLRGEILGSDYRFTTPFGERLMVYADYTASGRAVGFIERYLSRIMESYANTHTEDDVTGRSTTLMLHEAESRIKRAVGGNETTCVIAVGTGATGAVQKLQEILGVYVPPATRERFMTDARDHFDDESSFQSFREHLHKNRPVVFLGPYEHHSNEVSWRESLAETVEIKLAADGTPCLEDLERKLSDPAFAGRQLIGSFSAASNVTGIRTPVYDVARVLHRHGALACFDFAASAPYVEMNMNRDAESYFDAVFFSPHKFLGGPGACGLLVFNDCIYPRELPPTFASGGTVDYVGLRGQDYTHDIEAREKPGTPGTIQVLKAMLALELKEAVGQDVIAQREHRFIKAAMDRFERHPGIEILGNADPSKRIGIVSFNVTDGDRYLHPKFVTRLLNDLFGIQSRAGCSCAGPYGHRLLRIGEELSDRYRAEILQGCQGIKPGWVRVGFHYTMDDTDVDFVCSAVEFLAEHGAAFLPAYRFDMESGAWTHVEEAETECPPVGLECALSTPPAAEPAKLDRRAEYDCYLAEARRAAARFEVGGAAPVEVPGLPQELVYFNVVNVRPLPR